MKALTLCYYSLSKYPFRSRSALPGRVLAPMLLTGDNGRSFVIHSPAPLSWFHKSHLPASNPTNVKLTQNAAFTPGNTAGIVMNIAFIA